MIIEKIAKWNSINAKKIATSGKKNSVRLTEEQVIKYRDKYLKKGSLFFVFLLTQELALLNHVLVAGYSQKYKNLFTDEQRVILSTKAAYGILNFFLSIITIFILLFVYIQSISS